jgi:hypothetical protein
MSTILIHTLGFEPSYMLHAILNKRQSSYLYDHRSISYYFGTPEKIRTSNLLLRKQLLCPVELREGVFLKLC